MSQMTGLMMARKIAETAAARDHKLAARQVDANVPVASQVQYDSIMAYLDRCPVLPEPRPVPLPRTRPEGKSVTRQEISQQAAKKAALSFGDIPAGFYATRAAGGGDDNLDFWKVTEGKRPGYRFAKRVLGGGTTQQPKLVEISKGQQISALRAIIDAGIIEAKALYAEKEERCTECGRQLTDKASREHGMGPDCWEKYGA